MATIDQKKIAEDVESTVLKACIKQLEEQVESWKADALLRAQNEGHLHAKVEKLEADLKEAQPFAQHYSTIYAVLTHNNVRQMLGTQEKNVVEIIKLLITTAIQQSQNLQAAGQQIEELKKLVKESHATVDQVIEAAKGMNEAAEQFKEVAEAAIETAEEGLKH